MNKNRLGFTLAELLIALAILGIIATFTVPKLLQSSETAKKVALLKETISTVQTAYWEGVSTQTLTVDTNLYEFIKLKLHCIKVADNAVSEGLWPGFINGGDGGRAGCQLASGAVLLIDNHGGDLSNSGLSTIAIDYNGTQPVNENYSITFEDTDRLLLRGNPTQAPIVFRGVTIAPGKLVAEPTTQSYYNALFSNP